MKHILLILFVICFGNLSAQTKTAKQDTMQYELKQVTVSATRYPEEILEIPYAVSIISNEELKNTRGYGLDEVLSTIPGVLAQSRAGTQDIRLVIRGFGARGAGDRSNSGTSRGIRVMIDGFPETEPDGRTSFDNLDLNLYNEIEVVRSNASALWGNAAGGIVNLSSVPFFIDPFLSAEGSAGSYGYKKYSFRTGTTFGNGRLYVGFARTQSDGWRNHSAGKRSVLNVSLQTDINPQSKLGVYLLGSSNIFHIPGPLSLAEYNNDPIKANSTYEKRDERRYNRLGRIGISFNHFITESDEISAMIYVNPKFLQRSERGTFRDFTRYHIGGNLLYHNSSELSPALQNKLSIGADEAYQDGAILFYSLSPDNHRGDELRTNKREGANNFGAFVQDEVIIHNKLSIIAGLRYDKITYYSEDYLNTQMGLQNKTFERLTPKAGITYRFTDKLSLYMNLGGGVEVPAGNETDPSGTYGQDSVYLLNPLLDPINSTTYELGTKGLVITPENALLKYITYDLALYYIDVKNDIIPYRGGRFYFTAGKTKRTGVEIGSTINLQHGFSINGSFTYSINKYDQYRVDSAHYGNPGSFADYSDNKVAGIPDYFYNAGISYEPAFLYPLNFNISFTGMSEYYTDDANTIEVPSYGILNVSIGFRRAVKISDHFSLRGYFGLNNIFNKKYAASAFINPDIVNGAPVYLEPGMPRTFTLSVSLGIN